MSLMQHIISFVKRRKDELALIFIAWLLFGGAQKIFSFVHRIKPFRNIQLTPLGYIVVSLFIFSIFMLIYKKPWKHDKIIDKTTKNND